MTVHRGLPWSRGATDAETDDDHPWAALVPEPAARMIHAVDVAAPAAHTFRWLCQLIALPRCTRSAIRGLLCQWLARSLARRGRPGARTPAG
jgi:hypothetical protein